MRNYKSLILAGLLAFGFSSCNTDDLEKDIDNLANRVADFEAQVLKLNDEMNIIRVLMDGNKTITKYTVEGEKYVLTLSNGETITLTQGNYGGTYPKVEINGGNWYVDGSDTGIKAEAEDGIDTPQPPVFKIENGNWHVSYDGGKTYEDLKVSATETGTQGESPISDFKLDGNKFVFTIGSNNYEIPVIEDLTCQIAEESDMVTIAQGTTREVKINVNLKAGDLVRAIAPVEWKAVVSDYSALTGEQELTVSVTAPSVASKGVLTVEVTRGVNTITDEIVLKTGVTSYYDEYMAGMDIVIGDLVVNKYDYPNAIVAEEGVELPKSGLVFVPSTAKLSGRLENLILLPKDKETMPNVTTSRITFAGNIAMYGLLIDGNAHTDYLIASAAVSQVDYINIVSCKILPPKQKALTYCSGVQNVDKVIFKDNFVYIRDKGNNILNLTGLIVSKCVFENNIIAAPNGVKAQLLQLKFEDKNLKETYDSEVIFKNNTIYNFIPNPQGVTARFLGTSVFTNNVFYNDKLTDPSYFINDKSATSNLTKESYWDNISYSLEGCGNWKCFNSNSAIPTDGDKNDFIPSAVEIPLIIPDDVENEGVTVIEKYRGYGAVLSLN